MKNKKNKTEASLVKKVFKMANVLSADGVSFTDYIAQLTYILFLKMDDERSGLGFNSEIPQGFRWSDVSGLNGSDLMEKYEEILTKLSKEEGLIGTIFTKAANKISNPSKLGKVFSMVAEDNWYLMEGDFKGAVYEAILQKNGQNTKSGAGQYFTPRALINTIVKVVDPKIGETVADPACGTGGFLLSAYTHMKEQSKDIAKQEFLKKDTFFGADNTSLLVTLASMNLYLHDIGVNKSPVVCQDSLIQTNDKVYDVILANPPFGKRPEGSIDVAASRPEFYKTSDNQLNFLQHIVSITKTGGRVGVVLPDNVLTDEKAGVQIREKLLKECNLHTILRLPTGIFYANSIKTNVLFFEKGKPTKEIWVYDYRTGIKHTLVEKPLKEKHLEDFILRYSRDDFSKRKETYDEIDNPNGRWRKYSIDEIKKRNGFDLDLRWVDFSVEDTRNIQDVVNEMILESKEIENSINKIQSLLKESNDN